MNPIPAMPHTRFSGFACGLALLLAAAPAAAQPPGVIGSEAREALRNARTIRLEVKQEYDMPKEEPGETPEGEMGKAEEAKDNDGKPTGTKPEEEKQAAEMTAAPKPEEAKPAAENPEEEKFSLPLTELAEEAIKLAGWKLVGPGEMADLTLTVDVRGVPLGGDYIGTLAGHFYTGAELHGSVRLEQGGKVVTEAEISAEIPVAQSIHSNSYAGYGGAPRDAPFHRTLPEYCEAVFTVIGRARGPGPVLAGLKLENDNQQAGASRALLTVGDASVEPVLIEILGRDNDSRTRPAALGLGVHGRATALPALLLALRKDQSAAALAGNADPADDELVLSLTGMEDEVLNQTERAAAARRILDEDGAMHRAVEWALLQIEATDKFGRLTDALRDRDSVMLRRGAAVVLGGMSEPRAFEPLAAAVRDKEPLVRAAAIGALGRLKDERAAAVILTASDDATGYVSKLARGLLMETGQKRWEKFLQSRSSADTDRLLEGFKHSDPLVRAAAARAVDVRPAPDITAGLAALLRSDPQALVREAAAEALAEKEDDSNAPLLVTALGDTDAATRRHAVQGLTRFYGSEEDTDKKTERSRLPQAALAPVLTLLARKEVDETDAAALLERIEGPGVADQLLQALPGDRPPEVKSLLARELARRGEKRAVTPLLALLGTAADQPAGQFAADALVTLADPVMLEPLFVQLKSGTPAARRLALSVLGRLRQARAIGPLIAALRAGEAARFSEPAEGLSDPAREALVTLTGKEFSSGDEWLRWWKEQAGKPFVLPPPKKVPAGDAPPEEPAEEKTGEPKAN